MQLLPQTAKKIEVSNSTVDFFEYEEDGIKHYFFDSSQTTPPGPMMNAMAGLRLLDENSKLIMINHLSPDGLFPKIKANYNYEISDLEDGNVKVTFTYKNDTKLQTDFDDNKCQGV